jgi:D-lyxose ketol-isomerase
MKRSQVNTLLREGIAFFDSMNFKLPPWAFRSPKDWKENYQNSTEIIETMMGWDITDFGSGDYYRRGLFLFTLRNGIPGKYKKPYSEKIMMVRENQETPFHFHWSKMEDIINRGGGNLAMELYNATEDEEFANTPVTVKIDGITRTFEPGESLVLHPGESICLEQGQYHRFFAEEGHGPVLCGEVSTVNDDSKDNRFYEAGGRFPEITEDADPLYLLAADYKRYIPS